MSERQRESDRELWRSVESAFVQKGADDPVLEKVRELKWLKGDRKNSVPENSTS